MSNDTRPEIRFPGFTEDWEERKLGELAESFEYGLNASAKKFDGSNKYIRITDIDDISHKFNQSGVTSPDIDFASADNYKLKKGDILFARTGASVGKTYMYRESDGLVYYAGFLIRARIKSKISSEFVFQTTFTDSYNRFIKITSQRSGQPGVNAEEYSNFKIMIPNYEEQNAIGCFFKKIDDTITLHQRKLDLLKETKKGFLQKMFPKNGAKVPEIRFPGFTDDWEQRKLGDETKILAGGDVDKTKLKENGKYPVLANALTNDGIVGYYDDDFRIKAPAVTVTGRGDVGYAQARRVNFTPVVRLLSVKSKHDVDFLENSINNHKVLVESTGVPQLTAPQLGNYKIFFPTIEEETKIGSLFKKLDTAINIHQRELDLLKETKKGFLQKMFV
ncbi:restriction endonuclease subunit S [Enterococcus faecalis]